MNPGGEVCRMKRRSILIAKKCSPLFGALALSAACSGETPLASTGTDSSVTELAGGPPLEAVMDFGSKDVGSPFPSFPRHDQSGHAKFKIRPHTVVISAGGQVTFMVGSPHQVAIYEDGTTPDDINTTGDLVPVPLPSPPFPAGATVPLINDDDGRVYLGVAPFSGPHTEIVGDNEAVFESPGEYLVICTILPHFVGAKMYAWVIVK
jgi:plastocyanin